MQNEETKNNNMITEANIKDLSEDSGLPIEVISVLTGDTIEELTESAQVVEAFVKQVIEDVTAKPKTKEEQLADFVKASLMPDIGHFIKPQAKGEK